MTVRVGTAGWTIPKANRDRFAFAGSALERYAAVFNAVEINSTFYRAHRPSTFERWAQSVPQHFAFSVKVPKEITHERRLVDCAEPLQRFIDETSALGGKRDVLLVQLPPKLAFDAAVADEFFALLRSLYQGKVAFEPRHASWFSARAESRLEAAGVSRAAADPAPVPQAAEPAGSRSLTYLRLHGSPRTYYSAYDDDAIERIARSLAGRRDAWCIFDNTASGAAMGNALALVERLRTR